MAIFKRLDINRFGRRGFAHAGQSYQDKQNNENFSGFEHFLLGSQEHKAQEHKLKTKIFFLWPVTCVLRLFLFVLYFIQIKHSAIWIHIQVGCYGKTADDVRKVFAF